MKKGAKPELVTGWWRANLPQGLASAKDLEKALAGYEASLKQLVKSGSAEDCRACLETIDELDKIATKLQSEAQKALKAAAKDEKCDAADYANTVEVLKKLPAKLEEARDEADELQREQDGLFGNPEQYQPYLQKWLKKAKHKPLTFAFVTGATSLEHRVMLHGSRDPGTLLTKLKQETKLKKGIFGMAGAHAERNTTLVLELYTKPLPGLAKKFRLLLKRFKPLPFDRVLLTVEGKEIADIPDPEDTEPEEIAGVEQPAATAQEQGASAPEIPPAPPADGLIAAELMAKFKGLTGALNKALAADPQTKDEILGLVERFKALHKEGRIEAAQQTLASLDALLMTASSAASAQAAAQQATGPTRVDYAKARQAWIATRQKVAVELQRLERAILDAYKGDELLPEVTKGVRRLDTILERLDESLADTLDAALNANGEDRPRLHAEARTMIERYKAFLDTDPLVDDLDSNPFVPVSVQATLTKTLTALAGNLC